MGLSDNKAKTYYGLAASQLFMTAAVPQSEIKDCVATISSPHAYFFFDGCFLNMYASQRPPPPTQTPHPSPPPHTAPFKTQPETGPPHRTAVAPVSPGERRKGND